MKISSFLKWIILLVLIGVVVMAISNREWIYDYYRGVSYSPSAEMARIRDDLQLTERGEFLFNASWPELDERAVFNQHCQSGSTEMAVLGCYTGGNIYVFNIVDEQLDGIRELTAAHELLHAVWARMDTNEQSSLKPLLEQVYAENQEILESDLATYDESEQLEELYVRSGTEVMNLPEALEKHYGEIFKDQNVVVAFYDSYISVFRELRAELDALSSEMEVINAQVEEKSAEYERRAEQLDAEIVSFNSCADVVGCFKTEEEFYQRRSELIAEQDYLYSLYNEINGLIETYNAKVEIYNADVLKSDNLNTLINSNARPQEIK